MKTEKLVRGRGIIEDLVDEILYWCWHVSGDPVNVCISAHMDSDIYQMAEMYLDDEEDVEFLRTIDDEIYRELEVYYEELLQKELDRIMKELC